MNTKWQNKGR